MWSEKRKREYKVTPVRERIVRKDLIEGDCWIWQGSKNNKGYGMIFIGSRADGTRALMLVHRVAYAEFVGSLCDSDVLMHTCDKPACCNPEHLVIGTQKKNMQDALHKGRLRHGEKSHNAVLTDDVVRQMRALYSGKRGDVTEIAKKFGFLRETVGCALRGATWGHVYP